MQEVLKLVERKFNESAEYRKQFEEKWKEYERFYNGKQWQYNERRPVKNFIFSIIEGEVPILTDSRPSVDVIPLEESMYDQAKILSSAIQSVLEDNSIQLKNSEAIREALKVGTSHFYVDYDPDAKNGQGNVVIKVIDWKYCYPDPNASDIDECAYFGIKYPVREEDAKRKFSAFADVIKGNSANEYTNSVNSFIRPDVWDGLGGRDQQSEYKKLDGMVDYCELWLKDYEREPIPEEVTTEEIAKEAEEFIQGIAPDITKDEDHDAHIAAHSEFITLFVAQALQIAPEMVTEKDIEALKQDPQVGLIITIAMDHIEAHEEYKKVNPDGTRPKYSNNLRLIIKIGENIVYDDDAPVNDGLIPLAPVYCYKNSKSYWATGEIHNIIDAQKCYNEIDWHELQGLRLNTNSGWLVDEESGVKSENLTNDPGIVITKKKDGNVQRIPAGEVSPQLLQRKSVDTQAMEIISGVNEASQGRRPTGITAAQAIKYLQEQSVGRIRLKTRYFEEYTLVRLGKLIASRIVKYWNTERILRLYDDNGKIKFIKFDPKIIEGMNYDIKVVPGSTVGIDKETIFNLMSGLLDKGLISPKVFFQVNDVPYRTKILEEIEANDQMTMMIQQLQMENEQLKAIIGPALNDEQAVNKG